MIRPTVDQLAEFLAPISKYPSFAVPECAIRGCSDEVTSVITNGQEIVFLCDQHNEDVKARLASKGAVFATMEYGIFGITQRKTQE